MIDTIALVLKEHMFTILDHSKFNPSTDGFYSKYYRLGARSNMVCRQNQLSSELKMGIYKPRLSVTKRLNKDKVFEIMMKIEFSIPKLLYKNNFEEVSEDDYDKVLSLLMLKLNEMAVDVPLTYLENARVSLIHFSKNFILTDGSTPYLYLQEVKKSNITKRLDISQTDYRNGYLLKYHANSYEIVFYDKIRDLEQAKLSIKRVDEKDDVIQIGLFDHLNTIQKERPFEVLRMEIRLDRRPKIKQIFNSLRLNIEPTFKNVFKKDIAGQVLLYYLDQIIDSSPKVLYSSNTTCKDFIAQFIVNNPNIRLQDVFTAQGYSNALEENGIREVRILTKKFKRSNWYKFYKKMNSYYYQKNKNSLLELIRKPIKEFVPLKAVDFENRMSNNFNIN